jgi:hypothetical protein
VDLSDVKRVGIGSHVLELQTQLMQSVDQLKRSAITFPWT